MADIQRTGTKTQKEEKERMYGTKYSVLVKLSYFHFINMCIIDPMHNLFLGTAKKMIQIWKEEGILTKENVAQVQQRVDKICCSNDVGKLPSKMKDFSFNSFTADELKNWTLLFSLFAMKDILKGEHLRCWGTFVLACVYLCNQAILESDITVIDHLLLKFCKSFETLYGRESVTPNIHMHCHLVDCIRNYGPIYNFWLFSFERYNGLLGNIPSNKKDIELQLMRRFDRDLAVLNIPYPTLLEDRFSPVFQNLFCSKNERGSLVNDDLDIDLLLLCSKKTDHCYVKWFEISKIQINRKLFVHHLTETEYRCISEM